MPSRRQLHRGGASTNASRAASSTRGHKAFAAHVPEEHVNYERPRLRMNSSELFATSWLVTSEKPQTNP